MQRDEAFQNIRVKKWRYKLLVYIFVPVVFLFFSSLGGQNLLIVWLCLVALYLILLSALGIARRPSEEKDKRTLRPVVKILGIIVSSGFLGVLYLFLYIKIFDRESFFPQ